jgi:NAD-dependent DNA ligase
VKVEECTAVTKNVTLVVASDPTETTGKLQKARELNIIILSKGDFEREYI